MKRSVRFLLPAGVGLLLCAANARAQTATIEFNVPGPADWDVAANWLAAEGQFVPGDNFPAEVASISNGGVAVLNSASVPPISGLVLGNSAMGPRGTLRISSPGSLVVSAEGGGTLPGQVIVGANNGQGILEMNGGTLQADLLTMGGGQGANSSELHLQGSSTLAVSGNAILGRKTVITGPNVNFTVGGSLTIGQEFRSVITGANHTTVDVPNDTAYLTPTSSAVIEFSGYAPKFGDSWKLVESVDTFGEFATVTSAAPMARGLTLEASYDGGVAVDVENRLILNVNRTTGATTIENAIGAPISIGSYSIGSAGGYLSKTAGNWTSFDDANLTGWEEANPTSTHLSELNPTNTTAFAVGQSRSLGSPYQFEPTAFGQLDTDGLTFTYSKADGTIETGIVEMSGDVNNLVLYVDPATGAAAIDNQSPFGINLDFYSIASAAGSLSTTGWDSLSDQSIGSWDEATPTATRLSELSPIGSTLFASGSLFQLGDLFKVGSAQDLTFKFSSPDGTLYDGIVTYAAIPASGVLGDTNGDGDVNLDDLNAVRNNFGASGPVGSTPGDAFPFDGVVDLDDLNGVRNNFGFVSPSPVPEPGTLTLLVLGAAVCCGVRRRHKSS